MNVFLSISLNIKFGLSTVFRGVTDRDIELLRSKINCNERWDDIKNLKPLVLINHIDFEVKDESLSTEYLHKFINLKSYKRKCTVECSELFKLLFKALPSKRLVHAFSCSPGASKIFHEIGVCALNAKDSICALRAFQISVLYSISAEQTNLSMGFDYPVHSLRAITEINNKKSLLTKKDDLEQIISGLEQQKYSLKSILLYITDIKDDLKENINLFKIYNSFKYEVKEILTEILTKRLNSIKIESIETYTSKKLVHSNSNLISFSICEYDSKITDLGILGNLLKQVYFSIKGIPYLSSKLCRNSKEKPPWQKVLVMKSLIETKLSGTLASCSKYIDLYSTLNTINNLIISKESNSSNNTSDSVKDKLLNSVLRPCNASSKYICHEESTIFTTSDSNRCLPYLPKENIIAVQSNISSKIEKINHTKYNNCKIIYPQWIAWYDCDSFPLDPIKSSDFIVENKSDRYNHIISEDGLMLNSGLFFSKTNNKSIRLYEKIIRDLNSSHGDFLRYHPLWEQTAFALHMFGGFFINVAAALVSENQGIYLNRNETLFWKLKTFNLKSQNKNSLAYSSITLFASDILLVPQKEINPYPPCIASKLPGHYSGGSWSKLIAFSGCSSFYSRYFCENLYYSYFNIGITKLQSYMENLYENYTQQFSFNKMNMSHVKYHL